MSLTVIEAAAGTGKTVALTRRYLSLLKRGLKPEDILAVTFTRKAAAELVERISSVLEGIRHRGSSPEGLNLSLYRADAPDDPIVIEAALVALPSAPIGTIDSVVQRLIGEFALDARVPLAGGDGAPIDLPLVPGLDLATAVSDAAQDRLHSLEPADAARLSTLCRHFSIGEASVLASHPLSADARPVSTTQEVMTALIEQLPDLRSGITRAVTGDESISDEAGLAGIICELKSKNQAPRLTEPEAAQLARWLLAGGPPGDALFPLVHLLRRFDKPRCKALAEAMGLASEGESPLDAIRFTVSVLGEPVSLSLKDVRDVTEQVDAADTADRLRLELAWLQREATALATTREAARGRVSYDGLLEAATAMVRTPGHALSKRFSALLVDEMQDSNPLQLAFYEALMTSNPMLEATVVGDARQSIYLFRGAVPSALHALGTERVERLDVNYRSRPALVAAQRSLFGERLAVALTDRGLPPLMPLAGLSAGRAAGDVGAPITLVLPPGSANDRGQLKSEEMAQHVLDRFAAAMSTRWVSGPCTAAVLVRSWAQAAKVRDRLDSVLPGKVFIDGAEHWTKSRIVSDLRILLTAFGDELDELAWLGLWKLPPVGLSDRALARVRSPDYFGGEVGRTRLASLADEDVLPGPDQDPRDVAAFERARPAIEEALTLSRAGQVGAAVDHVAGTLAWREVLAVSPDPDSEACFDTALEWIRDLEQAGHSVLEMVDLLTPAESKLEAPSLRLHRGDRHVIVTTIHQSKGLEWDHVCLPYLGTGAPSGDQTLPEVCIGESTFRLSGVRFDATGGLEPSDDVQAALAKRISAQRHRAESVRLAYVAVTRARETVLAGISTTTASVLQSAMLEAWDGQTLEGVSFETWETPRATAPPPSRWVHSGERGASRPAPRPADWTRADPSGIGKLLLAPDRAAISSRIADAARTSGDYCVGNELISSPTLTLSERDLGEVVHAWFAEWAFTGLVSRDAIARHVNDRWGPVGDALVDFLEAVSSRCVREGALPWRLATAPSAELFFELPLIGTVPMPKSTLLVTGRTDLLVRDEVSGTWTVIDFKAGTRFPDHVDSLETGAKLGDYGPQLEGYAAAVNGALACSPWPGERVCRCILWFVRAGAWVAWEPVGLGQS